MESPQSCNIYGSRVSPINNVEIGLLQLGANRSTTPTIAPLQRVQNAAARLIFELGTREHVTASLLQLHWLPVRSTSLAGPVQAVLSHALTLLREVPGLSGQRRQSRRLRSSTSRSSIFVVVGLLFAAVTHQVRRACFHVCRPVCVELTTEGLTCCH